MGIHQAPRIEQGWDALSFAYRASELRPGLPDKSVLHALPETASGEPFYIEDVGGRPLAAFYHAVEHQAAELDLPPLVVCTGIGYEGLFLQPALRLLAEYVAAAGRPVLRFDYDGTGNSAGADTDPDRLNAWTSGIERAIDYVKRLSGSDRVALLGVRFGASMAAAVARKRYDIEDLVLWAPMSGKAVAKHMRAFQMLVYKTAAKDLSRNEAEASDAVEANGVVFSRQLLEDLRGIAAPLQEGIDGVSRVLWLSDDPADPPAGPPTEGEAIARFSKRFAPGFEGMLQAPRYTEVPEAAFSAIVGWLGASSSASSSTAPVRDLRMTGSVSPLPRVFDDGVVREELVWFEGGQRRVFGVVATPAGAKSTRALVFLNNAGNNTAGPHGMWPIAARALAKEGHTVVRVDLSGSGESPLPAGVPGYHPYSPDRVPDVALVVDWLVQRGHRDIALGGLCSGGYLAQRSAVDLARPEIRRLFLINVQQYRWREGDDLDVAPLLDLYEAQALASSARSVEKWKRLFKGEIALMPRLRILGRRASFKAREIAASTAARFPFTPRSVLARELEDVLKRGVAIDYIFSVGDPAKQKLNEEIGAHQYRFERRYRFRQVFVDGADHSFTPRWATDRLIALLRESLAEPTTGT